MEDQSDYTKEEIAIIIKWPSNHRILAAIKKFNEGIISSEEVEKIMKDLLEKK